ncbi:MAG: helix-turn-helix transcriptional regulator [Chitinispirillales bacterium]|jgi:transcriptional regulator with XRE-family HTH domain|nr:helix-turn-helix transcriptional regulator [Chitinispirillales bacterium]
MSINERIKKLRKCLGLTQTEFGKKIGIVQGHFTGIESGKKAITEKTVKVIYSVYGISEYWLRTGVGDMYDTSSSEKLRVVIRFFSEMNPEFQDFTLKQLDRLLELQGNFARII